jgi:hypothetical protein
MFRKVLYCLLLVDSRRLNMSHDYLYTRTGGDLVFVIRVRERTIFTGIAGRRYVLPLLYSPPYGISAL